MLHDHSFSPVGAGQQSRQTPDLSPYFSGRYPDGYRAPAVEPGHRPGERIVAGRPYISDLNLLNAYEADRAIEAAPADLTALSWNELTELFYAWLNRSGRRRYDGLTDEFGRKLGAERARRPEYQASFGRRG